MTNNNNLETLLALEAENKRLREALAEIKNIFADHETINGEEEILFHNDRKNDVKRVLEAYSTANRALAQPTVTTGLLDVVKAAVRHVTSDEELYGKDGIIPTAIALIKAVKALPPDVRNMVEGLE